MHLKNLGEKMYALITLVESQTSISDRIGKWIPYVSVPIFCYSDVPNLRTKSPEPRLQDRRFSRIFGEKIEHPHIIEHKPNTLIRNI